VKNILILILFALIPILTFATNDDKNLNASKTLSGVVTDRYGESIAGVRIKVKESGQEFFAGFDGKFCVSLPSGTTFHLIIESIGFEPLELNSTEIGFQSVLSLKSL
jgi:hypothetical protein